MAIKCWTIALKECDSGKAVFYYNVVRDSWVREFQGGCMFFDEVSAREKQKELNIYGVDVIEGSVA